jgi:hypothetical protein
MITDRPNECDSVIEHDGCPVVIVRWPGGDAGLGRTYARDVEAAIDAQRAAVRASPATLTHAEQLAEADAAIARLTRERDEAREDFEAASYDTARLITAIRTLTHTEAWALSEDVEANGRAGWVAEARKLGGRVEGMRARLVRERDEALADRDGWRTLAHGYEDELTDVEETLDAGDGEGAIEAVKRTVRERDEARALREQAITREEHWYAECQTALRECERLRAEVSVARVVRETSVASHYRMAQQLMLALAWGRELAERAGSAAGCPLCAGPVEPAETCCACTPDAIDALRAEIARLREQLSYWQLGNIPRLLGIAPDALEAVRGVLSAAEEWRYGGNELELTRAHERWHAAGRPLAVVPSPASEGVDRG